MTLDIELRRAELLRRCAEQREQICAEINSIEDQLGGVQRGIRVIQGLIRLPGLLAAGSVLAVVAITGRRRTVQLLSTGLALWAGARRLRRGSTRLSEFLSDPDF